MQTVVDTFLDLYAPDSPKWDNIPALNNKLAWTLLTAHSAANYLDVGDVKKEFTREIVEAATRVNYGQVGKVVAFFEGL